MEAFEVEVERVPVRCAPRRAPCPHCGKKGRRKQVLRRSVRSIAYKRILFLEIEYGEYRACCGCCKTFRTSPEGVEPKCEYDNKVRQAVLDRLLQDGMSVPRVLEAMERDFLLNLSEGFVYDCLHRAVRQVNMAEYRRWAVEQFSGTLCVDELHLGRHTLLLATDPLGDFPVAFALVEQNDGEHMRRFLQNLKRSGLEPQVVVTDGSSLYPKLLEELWPQARHQLCIFHVLQEINEQVLQAERRWRRRLARRGNRGRRRRRGRPSRRQQAARRRRGRTAKQKASYIFKHRYLIVKRREKLGPSEGKHLRQMFEYLPELRTLRRFVDRVHGLFAPEQSEHQARCRRAALVGCQEFAQVPELAKAMEMLQPEKFGKMIAFLKSPAAARVRTNNHVERCNRKLRYYEKVRYKWRRRRTIVRFIVLMTYQWWQKRLWQQKARSKTIPISPLEPSPSTKRKRKAA